jgi:hypothetical protein
MRFMSALRILVIPGSLRTGSHNAKLAMAAAYEFAQAGVDVTRISLGDFPLPIYDGDLQAKSGVPKNAINLKRMMGSHHGVVIVTPEYNSSVPPLVKTPSTGSRACRTRTRAAGRCFAKNHLRSRRPRKAGSAEPARSRRCG